MADRPLCRAEETDQEWDTEEGERGKGERRRDSVRERRKGNARGRMKGNARGSRKVGARGRRKDSARGISRERQGEWNMKLLKIYDYLDCFVRVRFALIIKTSFHVA